MARHARGRARPHPGQFRIIGGAWRGRRFAFADSAGLRPTPDRVRETLFNWLQAPIDGAACLDLYAGSGALGLEALSRGARDCVFVDRDAEALAAIGAHLERLRCTRARLVHSDAETFLRHTRDRFDVIFLDPPFAEDPWEQLLGLIDGRGLLAADGRVYLENAATRPPPALPEGWRLLRSKRAGRVGYHLASRKTAETP